ncbi:MAG: hypothetical protein HC825_06530 [Oscillatoriales cyanobacterium RM1_1_9]|nr:hypothetical protein [Oscillatoriales cyanobacterium SM2_3_0]NJO46814.1 hypothetical protein [Oscillatoriales cyanobacterium RM2_1_1]NJO71429.1 hypothetical protein [Oscillatoriales cyanobacterium RM1_1_9]
MSLRNIKQQIAQLLTCHPDDITTAYLKSVMRELGHVLDFRLKQSWITTLEVLTDYFTQHDRVFIGTGVSYFKRNPFYSFGHIPNVDQRYYHRETNWNITHKLQYCDPAVGVVERETWVIFCPDQAVYKVRRIRLRFTHLDGTCEQQEYDYSLKQPNVPCFLV